MTDETANHYPLEVKYRAEDDPHTHTWTKTTDMRLALKDAARCYAILNEKMEGHTFVWIVNHNSLSGSGPSIGPDNFQELLNL